MRLEEFKELPKEKQLKLVFEKADFVDSVIEKDTIFALYSIRTFFIELKYDPKNLRIDRLQVFEANERLDKYLHWQ